jgi:hypothetical protein
MTRLAGIWRLGLLLMLLASAARAQAPVQNSATPGKESVAGTLSGEVTDHRGTPLAGTSVIVTTPGGKVIASSTTDAGGMFRVVDLQPSDYTLIVKSKGFYDKIEKIKIKPRKTEKIEIKMKFMPPETN